MTRILYFSDAAYFGGAEKYLELLVSALPKDTYEPHVLTVEGARLAAFRQRLAKTGVITHEVSMTTPRDVSGYLEFARAVRKLKPELIHINLPGTYDAFASLVAPVAWFAGCRSIVTTEHLAMVEGTWKRRYAKRLGTLFISAVISITESNVEFLTRINGVPRSRITVIHNGVNMADFDRAVSSQLRRRLGLDDSTFVFAIVGSLVERKGHRYLLEAFAKLRLSGYVKSALLVIGEGEEKASLMNKCSDLGLTGEVFFLGQRDDIRDIMVDMDCLVVPSMMEGMPYVILEAMATSKPVIASRIHGIPEVIVEDKTGLLVPPGDVDSLYAAMRKIVADPVAGREMGVFGRQRIKSHFSIERMSNEVEHVYEAVLSGGGTGGRHPVKRLSNAGGNERSARI